MPFLLCVSYKNVPHPATNSISELVVVCQVENEINLFSKNVKKFLTFRFVFVILYLVEENNIMIKEYAKEQLQENGLEDWTVEMTNSKRQAGSCYYHQKKIRISNPIYQENGFEAMKNTVIHEISHALAYILYDETGHGRTWKQIFLELGGNGKRCHSLKLPKKTYKIVCSACDIKIGEGFRKYSNRFHRKCKSKVLYIKN